MTRIVGLEGFGGPYNPCGYVVRVFGGSEDYCTYRCPVQTESHKRGYAAPDVWDLMVNVFGEIVCVFVLCPWRGKIGGYNRCGHHVDVGHSNVGYYFPRNLFQFRNWKVPWNNEISQWFWTRVVGCRRLKWSVKVICSSLVRCWQGVLCIYFSYCSCSRVYFGSVFGCAVLVYVVGSGTFLREFQRELRWWRRSP